MHSKIYVRSGEEDYKVPQRSGDEGRSKRSIWGLEI